MEKNTPKYILIGVLFLLIEFLAVTRNLFDNYIYFFWFCDFVPILFAVLFFLKKPQYIKAIINFGLIPQVIFLINFLGIFLFGKDLFNLIPNFSELDFMYLLITFFLHLPTLIALLFTFKIKPEKNTLYYSGIFLAGIYLLTLIFTSSTGDINYVYSTLAFIKFSIPYYTFLWPVLAFLFLVIPTQGIQYAIYKLWKRKENKRKIIS